MKMTRLHSSKILAAERDLQNAKRCLGRHEKYASDAWKAYEETQDMRALWRWDYLADLAQISQLVVARSEARLRIANNG